MNLIPVEHQNQRILTTAQIAEAYGTDEKLISQNFSRNKDRYKLGKHYFVLEGEGLKQFKEAYPQFEGNLKFAPSLYLWTDKGALLHAKSLGTDKAWQVYETLVDDYFTIKEVVNQIATPDNIEKIKRADAMLINANVRKANFLMKMADKFKDILSTESVQLLIAGAAEATVGKPLLPKPQVDVTFTATEIAKEIGISANRVGRIANENGLKTNEFGVWVLDKSANSDKQVRSFLYNQKGRQKLIDLCKGA